MSSIPAVFIFLREPVPLIYSSCLTLIFRIERWAIGPIWSKHINEWRLPRLTHPWLGFVLLSNLPPGWGSRPCCHSCSQWIAAWSSPWRGGLCRWPSGRLWSGWRSKSRVNCADPGRRAPSRGPGTRSRDPSPLWTNCRPEIPLARTRSFRSCLGNWAAHWSGCRRTRKRPHMDFIYPRL